MKPIQVGLLGLGTVGSGTVKVLRRNAGEITRRAGRAIDPLRHWALEVQAYHEAGDQVVAVMHQHGRSKASGLEVDMQFAMVWTMRDGETTRMQMYADPAEAFEAVGLQAP